MTITNCDNVYDYPGEEFFSPVTISLGELVDCGVVDFNSSEMAYEGYNDDQKNRVNTKIYLHYYNRDISILPPGRWMQQFRRLMGEIMPKYRLLYEKIEANGINLLQDTDVYDKERIMYSTFPQTQLSGNQDYASNGNDREREQVIEGNILDKWERLKYYDDIDLLIVNDVGILFSDLMTVNFNGM